MKVSRGMYRAEVVAEDRLRVTSEDGSRTLFPKTRTVSHRFEPKRPFALTRTGDSSLQLALFLPDGIAYEAVGAADPRQLEHAEEEPGLLATILGAARDGVRTRGLEQDLLQYEQFYGAFFLTDGTLLSAKGSVTVWSGGQAWTTVCNEFWFVIVVKAANGEYTVQARPHWLFGPTQKKTILHVGPSSSEVNFTFRPRFDPAVSKVWCDWMSGRIYATLKNQGASNPPENPAQTLYAHFYYAGATKRVAVDALKTQGAEITVDTGYRMPRGSKGYVTAKIDVGNHFMEFNETNNTKTVTVSR